MKKGLPTILAWQVGPQLKFSHIARLYLHLQKSTMQDILLYVDSSQHLSHISELKNPKQNRQSKMSSCHADLAPTIQTCYQKRLSNNRRFLLSNLSQHKTLINSHSALRKEQQQIGSRSKPLVPSLPTKSGGICTVSSACKTLPSGMDKWQDADGVWSSDAGHRTRKHRIVFTGSSVQLRLLKTHGGDFWNAGIKEMVTARQC